MNCLSYSEAVERFDDVGEVNLYLHQLPEHRLDALVDEVSEDDLMELLNQHPEFDLVLFFRKRLLAVSSETVESLDLEKRAKLLMLDYRFENVLELLEDSETNKLLDLKALSLLRLKRYEEALDVYLELRNRDWIDAHSAIVYCYGELGRDEEREEALMRGVEAGCMFCRVEADKIDELEELDFEDLYDEVNVYSPFLNSDDNLNRLKAISKLMDLADNGNFEAMSVLVDYYTEQFVNRDFTEEDIGILNIVIDYCDCLIESGFKRYLMEKGHLLGLVNEYSDMCDCYREAYEEEYITGGYYYWASLDNPTEAISYFRSASSDGRMFADVMLGDVYMSIESDHVDTNYLALESYSNGCEKGGKYALFKMLIQTDVAEEDEDVNSFELFDELFKKGSYLGLVGLWYYNFKMYALTRQTYYLTELTRYRTILDGGDILGFMRDYNNYSIEYFELLARSADYYMSQMEIEIESEQ